MELSAELEEDDAWSLAGVDESAFEAGRVGPYRLGPHVRATRFGELILAIGEARSVVEVDLYARLAGASEAAIMGDIGAVAALRHRCLIPMIGAGVHDGVPYVVREHRLGRTLAELLEREAPGLEAGAAILHAVAETLAYLAESGPSPSAHAIGGVTSEDVHLGYDGSVALVGLGLRRARGEPDEAFAADFASCFTLARALEPGVEARLLRAIDGADDHAELRRAIRRRFGQACAHATLHVGALMRSAFGEEIAEDRAFFGLPSLQ